MLHDKRERRLVTLLASFYPAKGDGGVNELMPEVPSKTSYDSQLFPMNTEHIHPRPTGWALHVHGSLRAAYSHATITITLAQ